MMMHGSGERERTEAISDFSFLGSMVPNGSNLARYMHSLKIPFTCEHVCTLVDIPSAIALSASKH